MSTESTSQKFLPNLQPGRKWIQRSLSHWLVFLPLVILIIIPVIYIISMAFTTEDNQLKFPIEWLPNPSTIGNFTHIAADVTLPIAKWFTNSLIISTVGTIIVVFFSSLSVYAFARHEFPCKNKVLSMLLFSQMLQG
jgi:ABC-type maltose transport system permease subunit